MSASVFEIISILSERVGRQFDIPFQEELIVIVDYWAGTILKQSLEKRPQDRRRFIQSFVLPLEVVPEIECPIEYGCVLRTTQKVPKPIRGNNTLFDYIGSADFKDAWNTPSSSALLMYLESEKYVGSRPKPDYRDDYIYVYGRESKEIEYIGIQGVFSDFKELRSLKCGEDSCFDIDSSYPLTSDMIQQVVQAILRTELRLIPKEDNPEIDVVEDDKPPVQ